MKSLLYLMIAASIALTNCKNLPTNDSLQRNLANNTIVKSFGDNMDAKGSINLDQAIAQLNNVDSMAVKIEGKVTEVCQAKGCWMNVVSIQGESTPMFVQFKDYGFFMPKDCAGKRVVMDGMAYKSVTPVEELRHYAMDKGASQEDIAKITEPKEELKFMANGVLLYEK